MRCERLHELLPAYLDGDLSGRLNHQVSDHLDGCDRCRGELTAQQRALRTLDAGRYPVSIDLWADFSRRLQTQLPPSPSPWRFVLQPGLSIATAVTAVALIVGLAGRSGPGVPGDRPLQEAAKIAQVPSRGEATEFEQGQPIRRSPAMRIVRTVANLVPPGSVVRISRSRRFGAGWSVRTHQVGRRRAGQHPSPASIFGARPERQPVMLADLPLRSTSDAGQPLEILAAGHSDQASSDHSRSRPDKNVGRTGDPLRVAVALASAEQDTASEQMSGELLRMAREVARVSGEAGSGETSEAVSGGGAADHGSLSARANPTGT
jgi:hypothetical protein